MKKLRIIIGLLVIFMSCNNQDLTLASKNNSGSNELSTTELRSLVVSKSSNTLTEIEVQGRVLDFINNIEGSKSRSGNSVNIKSIVKEVVKTDLNISTATSRATNTVKSKDVTLYAFNLTNSNGEPAGFAVATGDERFPAILAYSDNGDLTKDIEDDFLFNFFSNLPNYINRTIAEYNKIGVDEYKKAVTKLNNISSNNRAILSGPSVIEKRGPLLPVTWGQRSPYSDVINQKKNSSGLLSGCVAIAIAQIMSSHKHATGGSYNWNKMTAYKKAHYTDYNTKKMIGTLIYNVAEAVHMNYGTNGSGAYSKYADDCFDKMGYRTPSPLMNYNLNTVKSSLKNGNSVYTSAKAKKKVKKYKIFGITVRKKTTYSEGHAYVIDGYAVKNVRIRIPWGKKKYINFPFTYLHVNFGWNGYKDGYYAAGTFDTNKGPAYTRSGTSGNYQYLIKILPNVSPR